MNFPNCSYVINTTCQYPMLIMYIKSIKHKTQKYEDKTLVWRYEDKKKYEDKTKTLNTKVWR